MILSTDFAELKKLIDSGQTEKARQLLLKLQAGYLTLIEESRHLRLHVLGLESLLLSPKVIQDARGLIWVEQADGRTGPFCPLCHEPDKSLIRLEETPDSYFCPSCEASYPLYSALRKSAAVIPFSEACRKLGI